MHCSVYESISDSKMRRIRISGEDVSDSDQDNVGYRPLPCIPSFDQEEHSDELTLIMNALKLDSEQEAVQPKWLGTAPRMIGGMNPFKQAYAILVNWENESVLMTLGSDGKTQMIGGRLNVANDSNSFDTVARHVGEATPSVDTRMLCKSIREGHNIHGGDGFHQRTRSVCYAICIESNHELVSGTVKLQDELQWVSLEKLSSQEWRSDNMNNKFNHLLTQLHKHSTLTRSKPAKEDSNAHRIEEIDTSKQ